MKVVHVAEDLVLMDRAALAQWTQRSTHTIRAKCTVHSYDEIGRALYNARESAAILDQVKTRGPNGSVPRRPKRPRRDPDQVGYDAVHARLRRSKGLATNYLCIACDRQAAEWAYDQADPAERRDKNGTFSLDPDRYNPMCRTCHRALDATCERVRLAFSR